MKTFKTFLIEQENLIEWGAPSIKRGIFAAAVVGGTLAGGIALGNATRDLRAQYGLVAGPQSANNQPPNNEPSFLSNQEIPKTPKGKILRQEPVNPQQPKRMNPEERRNRENELLHDKITEGEGFRSNAYIPMDGDVPTVGYGTTFFLHPSGGVDRPVRKGDTLTREEAREQIRRAVHSKTQRLERAFPNVFHHDHSDVPPELTAVLKDLAYNTGPGTLLNPKGTSVGVHLHRANNATDPKERLHHVLRAVFGTEEISAENIKTRNGNGIFDFHGKRDENNKFLPVIGLLNRRGNSVGLVRDSKGNVRASEVLSKLKEDGHITSDEHDELLGRIDKRHQMIRQHVFGNQ
jgi:GH24 family phage-related lysozyme (muramidase)